MTRNERNDGERRKRSPSRRRRDRTKPWWRRWGWSVGVAAVAVVLAVFVTGLLQGRRSAAPGGISDAPVSQELLMVGQDLYQASCAVCHGAQGEGFATAGIPAPPLDGSAHAWHHPDDQIIDWIRNGGVQMPAVGAGWNDDQVRAVMAYFKQWWEPWQQEAQAGEIGERIQNAP